VFCHLFAAADGLDGDRATARISPLHLCTGGGKTYRHRRRQSDV